MRVCDRRGQPTCCTQQLIQLLQLELSLQVVRQLLMRLVVGLIVASSAILVERDGVNLVARACRSSTLYVESVARLLSCATRRRTLMSLRLLLLTLVCAACAASLLRAATLSDLSLRVLLSVTRAFCSSRRRRLPLRLHLRDEILML